MAFACPRLREPKVAWGRIITKYKDGLHWKTSTKERINTRHVKVDVKVEVDVKQCSI